ncbi:hypothetical protein I7I48_04804 [Histoplasma ohiense]|nr:hypothetical protein I7I48_04804 [Histoplasma ohiense (nom. inval.)]
MAVVLFLQGHQKQLLSIFSLLLHHPPHSSHPPNFNMALALYNERQLPLMALSHLFCKFSIPSLMQGATAKKSSKKLNI